ncbi:MAG: sulfate adenylyltransferase, partial [Flavobacteriales bacterium]|nr:sulfate adenylyltransferase [Flavobacteriales bacterium]
NDISNVSFKLADPIIGDSYKEIKGTGSFILIDPTDNMTVAVGFCL